MDDLSDEDALRVLAAVAGKLNRDGVEATLDALADDGGGDADTAAHSRADGRRVLAPDPADGEAWDTPSLLD